MSEPYQPSNGSEGEGFISRFCAHCRRDQDEDEPCSILTWTMALSINDPGYPTEWIRDENGPRCTAFEAADDNVPSVIRDHRQMDLLP